LAGLLVWTGAASFIELGRAIPHTGGVGLQEYLRRCYGDFYGFMGSWTMIMIVKPSIIALIAIIFSEHLCRALGVSEGLNKVVAVVGIVVVSWVNCLGTKNCVKIGNGFLVVKLLAITSIVVVGIILSAKGVAISWSDSSFNPNQPPIPADAGIWTETGDYVKALFAALFCYGGWDTVGSVAEDLKKGSRDLPQVANSAMVIVLSGFTLMNAALYLAVPMEKLRERNTVVVVRTKTFNFLDNEMTDMTRLLAWKCSAQLVVYVTL